MLWETYWELMLTMPSREQPSNGFWQAYLYIRSQKCSGYRFRPSDGRATAEHGPWHNDEITALVNGGNGGWDPLKKEWKSSLPRQVLWLWANQKDGMIPALRAAYTPMSDTRFDDLMTPAWNNNGYSQGTGSAAFLRVQTGVFMKVV